LNRQRSMTQTNILRLLALLCACIACESVYPYYTGFNAPYSVQWAATSFHPAYGPYQRQQWSQQAAARSMPASPYSRYPYAPKPNPNIYQRPVARQIMQSPYQPAQYNPAMNQQFNTFNAFTTSPSCDLCNGDCNNWSCFGCGGCETPQMVQQTYMYPYQRQDAAFHDSFAGHEMALSGMVLWPVPKMPRALKKLNPPKTRSETYEEEADDEMASGDGSGDDEDDEDDTR